MASNTGERAHQSHESAQSQGNSTMDTGKMTAAPDLSAPAALRGLSESEIEARRARGQGNLAPLGTSRSYVQILRENVFTFINNVLYVLGIALVALGRYTDAILSVGLVLLNVLVSVVQEVRAKRTLDHIAVLTRPKATVIRDGKEQAVTPDQVVLGDVLVARPGDQIVVDGQVIGDGEMDMDESLLTGESDYVLKGAGDPVYSGSFCVAGTASYEAKQVGTQALVYKVTEGARAFRRTLTPLQRDLGLTIRVILLVAILFEIVQAARAVVDQLSLVQSVQGAVVIAGLVPNGLLVAMAVAYGLGAVRIARKGALVQQANAVESLSHVDVLCLDKTGTLTANRIVVHAVHPIGIDERKLRRLLGDFAASTPARNRTVEALAEAFPGRTRHTSGVIPFSSRWKWSAIITDDPELRGCYVLGAPEMLQASLPANVDLEQASGWEKEGLRVVLFATAQSMGVPQDGEDPLLPANLQPLGLVSFSDELRPEARATLASFTAGGIALKIISGDSPNTVAALARQVGLPQDMQVIAGPHLDGLSELEFAQRAEETTIFGRITPQQKEHLVRALRGRGHFVAMIGDGVNDVLSLKQADLAIAMETGSQATRAVADMVLLNDSFAVLPAAFREGQRIVTGMQENLKLFMTRVVFAALLIAAVGAIGGFPFAPTHNAVLTLFTVGIPVVALSAWARSTPTPRGGWGRSLVQFVVPASVLMMLAGFVVYLMYLPNAKVTLFMHSTSIDPARDLMTAQSAVTTLGVFSGLLLVPFVSPPTRFLKSPSPFSGDWRPTLLALALLGAYVVILAVAPLRDYFELVPLTGTGYLAVGLIAAVWAMLVWLIWRARLLDRWLGIDQ